MLGRFKQGHWPIFFMSMMAAIVNLLLPIVLVRILSARDIGIYKIFFLYVQVITFLSMSGGPLYSVYYWIGKKGEEGRDYLKQSWLLSIVLSSSVVVIGSSFLPLVAKKVELTEDQSIWLLIAAALTTPAAYFGEYLISKGRRIWGSLLNSGFEVLKGVVIVTTALLTRDINIIFIAFTALFGLKLLLNIALGVQERIFDLKVNKERMIQVFRYCAPISIAGTLGFFVDKVDMILLSSQITPSEFAYYSLGCLVVPPLFLLEMSVQKVLIPSLSRCYHERTFNEAKELYKSAQRDIALFMIPAVVGLFVFSRPILELLFTAEYLRSSIYLKIFAIGYLAHIFPHDSVPRASGKTAWLLKIYIIFAPLSLLFVYLAAKHYGAVGALSMAVAFKFIPKLPNLIYSANIMGWKLSEMFATKSLMRFSILSLILGLLSEFAAPLFPNEKWWFFTLAPIFATIYLGIFYFIKKSEVSGASL